MGQIRPFTVLIVEDQPIISFQLSHILRRWDQSLTILTAFDGIEGLQVALEARPDIIIADLAMPKMDGHNMVKSIRQDEYGKSGPIIGTSASDPADIRTGAFRELCNDYLEKPFDQKDVLEKVASLLFPDERL